MKPAYKEIPGSIVAPRGFSAGGVFCDIKRLGTGKGSDKGAKRDLALIFSSCPAAAAGMFTTNQVCAAPVKICVPRVKRGKAQAIVVNSGNANACTGVQGMVDAREMVAFTEKALGLKPGLALVGSTGRIGMPMPMDNVRAGIVEASTLLGSNPANADHTAEAIMTSDTCPKQAAVSLRLGGKEVRLGGICKGAGMIQPGMSETGARPASLPSGLHATMLAFITTDAAISLPLLREALREAVAMSFNRITVDGDMSTNDTVLILANGMACNRTLTKPSPDYKKFRAALNHLCLSLARKIVRDGEGVHRVVTVRVSGARSVRDADAVARSVANSALVKTSWHGGDPNWGRIMDAIGYSAAKVVEEKIDIGYAASGAKAVLWSLLRGQPTDASFQALCSAVAPSEFDLHIRLNLGRSNAVIYAADLTEAYVDFNKGNVGDPSSLGG